MLKTNVELQKFDSEIFGRDFYRIKNVNPDDIRSALLEVIRKKNIIIDAKIQSKNIEVNNILIKMGFLKICTQTQLVLSPKKKKNNVKSKIYEEINISNESADKLANNFIYDRFSQDIRFQTAKKNLFYKTWILNSLKNKTILAAKINEDFCSFKIIDKTIIIDLLSVLEKRKGHASDLLSCINNYAIDNNIETIKVVTEIENEPALKTYLKNNFIFHKFITCYHFFSTS